MKILGSALIGMAILLMIVVPNSALAADSLFLKLDGIQGESTDPAHPREIILLSYGQAFTRPAGAPGGGGVPPAANCGAITVTKLIDTSSASLIAAVLTARPVPTGVITFRKTGEAPLEYYTVRLTDVLIHSISQSDVSPTDPTTILEQISMSARRFQFEYTPQLADGSLGQTVTFGWDCASNSPV
jgi:type VI secretion system secreted protein Hcp